MFQRSVVALATRVFLLQQLAVERVRIGQKAINLRKSFNYLLNCFGVPYLLRWNHTGNCKLPQLSMDPPDLNFFETVCAFYGIHFLGIAQSAYHVIQVYCRLVVDATRW